MSADWKQKSHELEIATFAGGCFWCMVAPFEDIEGVKQVLSGLYRRCN